MSQAARTGAQFGMRKTVLLSKPSFLPSQKEVSGVGVLNKVLEKWFYQASQVLPSTSSMHDEMSSKMR